MAGFNHVVGPTRFVGYFLPRPDRCLVTVFEAGADDEALAHVNILIRGGLLRIAKAAEGLALEAA